jgi:alkaline phosphatase
MTSWDIKSKYVRVGAAAAFAIAGIAVEACSDDPIASNVSRAAGADAGGPDATLVRDMNATLNAEGDAGDSPPSETSDSGPAGQADAGRVDAKKQILFFLGDGMGIPVITAARIYSKGEEGDLTMDTLPESGFVRTYSNDMQVTDSAPSMSAYMTGVKTNNDVVSMSPDTLYKGDGGTSVKTFLELAEAAGFSTGVVTTTRVTHATPGATYAHSNDRDREDDIAAQLVPGGIGYNAALGNGLEVVFGGGRKQFLPKVDGSSGRSDGRNLVDEMKSRGYVYADTLASLSALPVNTVRAFGLFTSSHMNFDIDRTLVATPTEPSLKDMTLKAMDILGSNSKGYFLMVEGGRIDHALHETNAKRALAETVAFDDALAAALAKAKMTDPTLANTLVVVTADHDHTMMLNGYSKRTGKTTAENAGILGVVHDYARGTPSLDSDNMPFTILGFGNGENRVAGARSSAPTLTDSMTSANDYHQEGAIRVAAGSETHGGTDVAIMAIGRNAEDIHGFMDNTEVFNVLRRASEF